MKTYVFIGYMSEDHDKPIAVVSDATKPSRLQYLFSEYVADIERWWMDEIHSLSDEVLSYVVDIYRADYGLAFQQYAIERGEDVLVLPSLIFVFPGNPEYVDCDVDEFTRMITDLTRRVTRNRSSMNLIEHEVYMGKVFSGMVK